MITPDRLAQIEAIVTKYPARMNPTTTLELIQSLRQCQEALADAQRTLKAYAVYGSDWTVTIDGKQVPQNEANMSLARIEGILNG